MSNGEISLLIIGIGGILVGVFLPQKEIDDLKDNPFLTVDKKFDWYYLFMMIINPRHIFNIVIAFFPRLLLIGLGMILIGVVLAVRYIP